MEYTKGDWTTTEITKEQGLKMSGGYKYGLWADTNTPTSSRSVSIAFIKCLPDAHLIAAAPKMYKALKLYISHQAGKRGHYCSECHNEIEKAIVQAEGKE